MTMAETVRLRLVFEDHHMLTKSKKKEGLKRSWLLLKPQLTTISDLSSHLKTTFRLHRTCPHGIILSMDGFVLPPFESICILKDKDIICVKRKGGISTDDKPAMLPSAPHVNQYIELPKLLAIEGFQEEETGGCKSVSDEDEDQDEDEDYQLEDAVRVESKSDGNATSKKRKASKKLKSPSQKKIKLSSNEKLVVIPEAHEVEDGSSLGPICQQTSLVKKDNEESASLSTHPKKSTKLDRKQSNDFSGPTHDERRFLQPQDDGGTETKKVPSRSARRKKAKRRWLRELKLQKEKIQSSPVAPALEKGGQQLPSKDNNCIVSDVNQQPDDESEDDDDIIPVEIRPGHIRFEPLRKVDADQAVKENQFPMETSQWNGFTSKKKETFQWNGITSKKKGQKWGKERIQSSKQDDYEHSSQECPAIQNAGKKDTVNNVDFDKLTPYTNLPKEGDVIAYRLIELSASWTPELSSFRVGKISQYDAKSNRIWLEPVLEYPFDFKKKIDEEASPVQYDPSPYGEDGSLEIDYLSLADVRLVKHGNLDSATTVTFSDALVGPTKATNGSTDEKLASDQTARGSCMPEREGHTLAKENGEVNVWDEINEALTAKKAKLSQGNGWNQEESSGTRLWSQRALRCSALGPTMAFLRSQNGL